MEPALLESLADGLLRLVKAETAERRAPADGIGKALEELAARIRRDRSAEKWDGANTWIPSGVRALFVGGHGTGKTLAALHVARTVGMRLYRIDLARIVSQYIGETEKNLDRVFESAAAAGAMLLFDEADALFGKRTEVSDAHDRYANIDVSDLLQRIESFRRGGDSGDQCDRPRRSGVPTPVRGGACFRAPVSEDARSDETWIWKKRTAE
jgi:hypothetical protein